ncbi:hypothetical protein [Nocardioides caldifontis]|uniref:hypothetical protein n=1 Tax=Nocardioides caldifontis TaxID=2588938 RepID=UPI001396C8A1|nr:hypothetical protein [Nocardioides caldifontis]
MTQLTIGRRFNGPAHSGNGGCTAGLLAAASGLPGPVTVRLLRPPPLEEPLDVVPTGGGVGLRGADGPVATAATGEVTWSEVEPVAVATARAAEASYAGLTGHPFPTCFVCGPDREVGDGLRLFPGRVAPGKVAATWEPVGAVDESLTWAALDCPSAWSTDLEARPLVLGEMTAQVLSTPQPGTSYVVVGQHVGGEGRKVRTASALFDADGRLLARAEHVWLEIGPEMLARLRQG